MSTPALTDRQRHHRKMTREAMKRMVYHCPACRRGQNRNPIDISGCGDLLWICVYCEHTWGAGDRSLANRPDTPQNEGG